MRTLWTLLLGLWVMGLANVASAQTPAPDFTLKASNETKVTLSDLKGSLVVLEWWNHECPFIRKFYDSGKMQDLQRQWTSRGVKWLTIASSAAGKQGFVGPRAANRIYQEQEMASTYILHDPKGIVGRLYQARTTPHMFVIDKAGNIVYRGALDSIASVEASDIAKATNYVDAALTALTAGKPIATASTTPYGCSVKY